jgi:carbon monoxide dehydrogenase subunit G
MASIRREIAIAAPAEEVWRALRDLGNTQRVFPGVLIDCRLEDGARVVTFANGLVFRERIVDLDDAQRRLTWSAVGGRIEHHNASMQVSAAGGGAKVVWIADVLPHELAGDVAGLMDQGAAAMRRALERSP